MAYFPDTNICIYLLKGAYPGLARRFTSVPPAEIKIASMVEAELRFGAEKSQKRDKVLRVLEAFLAPFERVAFCARGARQYALLRKHVESRGTPVGPNDLVIASTVQAHDGTLITHNVREFRRIASLKLEDWTT